MADPYLAISEVANDENMNERMRAAATQQAALGLAGIGAPLPWVEDNRYLWASSPTWGDKWRYALNSHPDDPEYQPGADEAVITDADILATVQALGGPGQAVQDAHEAPQAEREANTQAQVAEENQGGT